MKTLIIRHDVKNHDLYLSFASDIPSLFFYKIEKYVGTDGRAVASDTKDLRFEFRHLQNVLLSTVLKAVTIKIKKKEAGIGPI